MSGDRFANLRWAAWRDATRVLAGQLVALVLVSLGALPWGRPAALSALIGAAIGLLANAYLAFATVGKLLLTGKPSNMWLSWLIRVALVVSLVLIAMRSTWVVPASLVAGLAAVMVAHWLTVSFWLNGRR